MRELRVRTGTSGGDGVVATSVLRCAPAVLARRTRESIVVLGDAAPVVLRGTAVAVWEAFATPRMVADVVAELAAGYGEPPAVIEREVLGLLERLWVEGAVVAVTAPALDGRS